MNSAPATVAPQCEVWELSDDFDQLIEKAKTSTELPVVAIVAESEQNRLQHLNGLARASATTSMVRSHISKLGPLGRAVLCEMAQAMQPDLDIGGMLEVLQIAENQVDDYGIMSSVSKLRQPSPSLWQHLSSAWPSTIFVAKSNAEVLRPRRLESLIAKLNVASGSHFAFKHEPEQAKTRQTETSDWLVSAYGADSAVAPKVSNDSVAKHWGKDDTIEVCFAPKDLQAIVNDFKLHCWKCSWCGCETTQQNCRFCGSEAVGYVQNWRKL